MTPAQDPTVVDPSGAESADPRNAPMAAELIDQPDSIGAWLVRLLKGIIIGVGFILPGLSGGVMAVIFKLYDPLIRFLANMRHNFVKNMIFFTPVGIGGAIGVVLFSIIVEKAFGTYAAQFVCLFIGFVIGTFPSLFNQAGRQGRSAKHYSIMAIAAVAIFAIMVLGGKALVSVPPSIPAWFGSGALIGLGVIVPGMSPSNFLIYFGLYEKMAAGIAALDLTVIIPLFLGLVACVLLFAKVANWLFDTYYAGMYHFILGMVVGSSLAIFPTVVFPAFTAEGLADSGLSLVTSVVFALAMLLVGVVASYAFSLLESRVAKQKAARR